MKKSLFERRFGKNPADFSSIEEVNSFVEKKIGHKLETEIMLNLERIDKCLKTTNCIFDY